MEKKCMNLCFCIGNTGNFFRKMKLLVTFFLGGLMAVSASTYSQQTKFSMSFNDVTVKEVFKQIEEKSEFVLFYNEDYVNVDRKVSIDAKGKNVEYILDEIFKGTKNTYKIYDRQIVILAPGVTNVPFVSGSGSTQQKPISGRVTDLSGAPLPGVTVVIKGTTTGIITDMDGNYSLNKVPENATLVFSFVGMKTQEISTAGKLTINVTMEEETIGLEEVVAVGYGTMRKQDLTGSVQRANIESFAEQPNVSLMQSLQGSVPGLNVGQVNTAGQEPEISVRGLTTISGETTPLIVLDGVIFRGNIIDINPNDIESVDILKDASSTAVYGSQAANGVIIITTSKKGGKNGKPVIRLSSQFSFQRPHKTYEYPDAEYFQLKTKRSDFYVSMTEESGYLEENPNYSFTSRFNTSNESWAYENGITVDWYDLVTRDNAYTQSHNISISNNTDISNYYISLGYSDQLGYMVNEDYKRINARINIDNKITNWLTIGVQSFMSQSDYSGVEIGPKYRYEHNPYMTVYDGNGDYVTYPGGQHINPFISSSADDLDKRLSISGNVYATIDVPFIKGLSYKFNFNNTYINTSKYSFLEYGANFRGSGSKLECKNYDWTSDNIISYKKNNK